ncbi:hypothetical protein EDB89DRAFT_1558792 [Lactarius sanguifluus]|nr:hypothetical protein EDB89DRAFT_1558792 [Lactarius sanguifluus]
MVVHYSSMLTVSCLGLVLLKARTDNVSFRLNVERHTQVSVRPVYRKPESFAYERQILRLRDIAIASVSQYV